MKLQELFDKFKGVDADIEDYSIISHTKPLPPKDGWECNEYDYTVITIKCKRRFKEVKT